MPPASRLIAPSDLMPDAEYAKVRKERRAELLPIKRLRRVALGPVCTFYFETYETMLFQVQEMLLTEGGGPEQVGTTGCRDPQPHVSRQQVLARRPFRPKAHRQDSGIGRKILPPFSGRRKQPFTRPGPPGVGAEPHIDPPLPDQPGREIKGRHFAPAPLPRDRTVVHPDQMRVQTRPLRQGDAGRQGRGKRSWHGKIM